MAKVIFRMTGPEIREAIVEWTEIHTTCVRDIIASLSIYNTGTANQYVWTLDDDVHIKVTMESEFRPGHASLFHMRGVEIKAACQLWAKAHLVLASNLTTESEIHKPIYVAGAVAVWDLENPAVPVYVDLTFDSEK